MRELEEKAVDSIGVREGTQLKTKSVEEPCCKKYLCKACEERAWVALAGFRNNHLTFNQSRGRVSNIRSWGQSHLFFPSPPPPPQLVGDNSACSVPSL